MVRYDFPSVDTYRLIKRWDRRNESQAPRVVHTNVNCPHVERMDDPEVIEPGEGLPVAVRRPWRAGGWCEWCAKRELDPGEYGGDA